MGLMIIKAIVILIAAPIIGGFLEGIDRKISAKMQGRIGPSLLQPWYDFRKLTCKENVVVNKYQNIYIVIYSVFVICSLLMLVFGCDLLMIIFVYTIANVFLIVGAVSTGSPYSKIGGERETLSMLIYEPVLVFYAVSVYMLSGSFRIASLSKFQRPLIVYIPLIFVCMLFVMIIKFKKSPFDFSTSHHAHQELVKGMFTEFSGPAFAIVELTHWYEYVFLLGLMSIFWKPCIIGGIIIAILTYLFVIIMDNISARLSWQWALKFSWTILVALCTANVLFIYLNNLKII